MIVNKNETIKKYTQSDNDTGSSGVQVGLLTERISQISDHLKKFPKDKHSQFGLIKLVGKRKRHLAYLKKQDRAVYDQTYKLMRGKQSK